MTTAKKMLFVAALAAGLLLPAQASATTTVLTAPAIPGVAQLPGPIAATATPAPSMGILQTKPNIGLPGTPYTIAGTGLAPNANVSIVWMTANVTWVVDARPDSVDYLGRNTSKFGVVIDTTTTDANGAFSVNLIAPKDFGGIHDIYAVVDGVQVSKGGFLVARSAKMSPKKGPVGTMITLTYSGLGASLYEGGASLQYDNHYVGALTANWTRGVAKVHIRATGGVGKHIITVTDAISFDYLNIQQSPIPWGTGHKFTFRVTKDYKVAPKPQIDWPVNITPTMDARTTMFADGVDPSSTATAQVSKTTGPVLSSYNRHRIRSRAERPGRPRLVDGRRQPGQLHGHVLELRLRSARHGAVRIGRIAEHARQHPRRARRLARDPASAGRQGDGPGAVLRQAERRR